MSRIPPKLSLGDWLHSIAYGIATGLILTAMGVALRPLV